MTRHGWAAVLAAASAAALPQCAMAPESGGAVSEAASPAEERRLPAEWRELLLTIDRFDRFDPTNLPFVRVTRRMSAPWGEVEMVCFGFLVADDGAEFEVRPIDGLGNQRLARARGDGPDHESAEWEEADLASSAKDAVEPKDTLVVGACPTSAALLVARACLQRGHEGEARRLCLETGSLAAARDALGSRLDQHNVAKFSDPTQSRADLLELHRAWLATFSGHRCTPLIEKRATALEALLSEDRARAASIATPAEPSPADLVRSLRDQFSGVAGASPRSGWSCFLEPLCLPHDDPGSPAARILERGLVTVPFLIEALSDESPSRCVLFSLNTGYVVLEVGDLAEDLLRVIGGVDFHGPESEREWRTWWSTFQQKGEDAALLEIVLRGGWAAAGAAERLLHRAPESLGENQDVARKETMPGARTSLVESIGRIHRTGVVAFLEEEVVSSPYVTARVRAAEALRERGERVGLAWLATAWLDDTMPGESADRRILARPTSSTWSSKRGTASRPPRASCCARVIR